MPAKKRTSPKKTAKKSAPKKQAKKVVAKKKAVKKVAAKRAKKPSAIARKNLFVEAMSDPRKTVTRAAIDAGFSEKSASTQGSKMLRDTQVQKDISRARLSLAARCGITPEKVMAEFAAMGFSNMLDYTRVNEKTGEVYVDLSKMTREQAAAIKSITVEEYMERKEGTEDEYERVKRTKFELHPKEGPLTKLAAHLGIKGFKTKHVELTGPGGGPVLHAVAVHTMHLLTKTQLEMLAAGIDPAEQATEPDADEYAGGQVVEGEVSLGEEYADSEEL